MCGACGRVMVPDEVLGPIRTLRQQLIAAQIINAVCQGLPGIPGVQLAGDTWLVRSATGAVTPCSTVSDVWGVILSDPGAGSRSLEQLIHRLRASGHSGGGLPDDVIKAGMQQANAICSEYFPAPR